MATQTLEFNAPSGLTLSCKVFALNSDTVVDTQTATERTNDKNRYRVSFTDLPAGAYRLNAFVGSVGGFANEVYDVTLSTATFYPRSEDITLNGKIIGTLATGTHQPNSGDAFARLGAPAGASIAADIAAIDAGGEITVAVPFASLDRNRNSSPLTRYRGTDWVIDILDVGTLSGVTVLYAAVKKADTDADNASIAQIKLTIATDPGDGLLVLNGAAASDATDGSIAVSTYTEAGETKKKTRIALTSTATSAIKPGDYRLGLKAIGATEQLALVQLKVENSIPALYE